MTEIYADTFGFLNPIGGKLGESAKTIGEGVLNEGKKGANIAQITSSNSLLGKVHDVVFDLERGVVTTVDEVVGTPVTIKEVNFYLATAKNLKNPTHIDYYKPDDVASTKGNIYFIIHGWVGSRNSSLFLPTSWYPDLTEVLIKTHPNAHVVQVDWNRPARNEYALAAFKTESVGNLIGVLVNRLVSEYKVPSDHIILIGHSLGAQISGWVGKHFKETTGRKLPRIIALDPAGPLFIHRPDSGRLNKDDAKVVMVIHTDGGKLGFPSACGTIDFFPNGGSNQPGCLSVHLAKVATYVDPVVCDHYRAWDFFIEAANSTRSFLARNCESFGNYRSNTCKAVEVAMGDLETTAEGSFYLETNSERPFNKFINHVVDNIKGDKVKNKEDKVTQSSPKVEQNLRKPSPSNFNLGFLGLGGIGL